MENHTSSSADSESAIESRFRSDKPVIQEQLFSIGVSDLIGVLGFALYLSWIFLILSNSMFLSENSVSVNVTMTVVYFLMGEVAASFIVWIFSKWLASNTAAKVLIVLVVLLAPTPVLSAFFQSAIRELFVWTWFITGFGAVFLLALWGGFLAQFNHRSAVFYPAVAMFISAIITFLALCAFKSETVRFLVAFLPVVSVVFYIVTVRTSSVKHFKMLYNPDYMRIRPPNGKSLLRSSCAMFSNSLLLGFVFFAIAATQSQTLIIVVCFAMLISAAFKMFDARKYQRFEIRETIKVLAPTAAIGLLPLPYLGSTGRIVCMAIMMLIGIAVEIVVWTAVSEYTRVNKIMPFSNMAFGRLGCIIGMEIGYLLAYLTLGFSALDGPIDRPLILIATVIVIIVLQSFIFKDNYTPFTRLHNVDEAFSDVDTTISRGGRWKQRCESFADTIGLTTRQREVLMLLAKGYSTSHIEEVLVVSDHTVKAHIYNIYRKANVHTRQELITLIEQYPASVE